MARARSPEGRGAAGSFDAFQKYVQSREDAEALLRGQRDPKTRGSLLLFGPSSLLLGKLADAAIGCAGAGLTKKWDISDGRWADGADVATLVCDRAETATGSTGHSDVELAELVQGALSSAAEGTVAVYCRDSSAQREPWAVAAASHEFEALPGSEDVVTEDFRRLVRVLRCPPAPCLGPGTYFVSLTFPDVTTAMSSGEEWKPPDWAVSGKGGQPLHSGLEVRADLLRSQDEAFVLSQLAVVRRRSEGLPIIYTVRSKEQGGAFPDNELQAWRLMATGLRFGVEYVDVEACWTRRSRHAFISLAKGVHRGIRVIGSYHAVQRPLSALSDTDVRGLFHECAHGPVGGVDVVKVVGRAESAQCSIRVNQAALAVRPSLPAHTAAVIAICTTDAGRLSRALNVMLGPTPVAHPSLPGKAAPGQLSAVEIEQIRQTLGLEPNPFSVKGDEGGGAAAAGGDAKRRRAG